MTSLSTLRDAFVNGLNCIKHSNTILTPIDMNQINTLIDAVSTDKITHLQLGTAASLVSNNICMKPIEPIENTNPLNTTCFQFGQGRMGWYFCYGHMGDVAFNFMLFRLEMAPPTVIEKMNIPPAQGCLYGITAGYGSRDGNWITLPNTIVQGDYICQDESFLFTAIPNSSCPWLIGCNLSLKNGIVQINIDWKIPAAVGIHSTLTALKPPIYQGEKGCVPCIAGSGTLYWSYTNMQAKATIGPIESTVIVTGTGWFDHQWLGAGGGFTSNTVQLISNIQSLFSMPIVTRWIWITLQLAEDLQYMIFHLLPDLPKVNNTYDLSIVKIKGNNTSYNIKGTATVKSMIVVGAQSFPTQYSLTIENITYTLTAAFGNSLVYLPKGSINWEGPGDVLDSTGKPIGIGFLEANQLLLEDDLIKISATQAGINASKFNLFRLQRTPILTGLLSILLVLIVLAIIIFIFIWSISKVIHLIKN